MSLHRMLKLSRQAREFRAQSPTQLTTYKELLYVLPM
uniref:Uncharacterized protein n=1 Tax=Anguilla anguilla TaxID=7936 RepID=A0A0E9XIR2_ANGAN